MATINLGAIKFNWKGAYAGGTAYTVDDVVSSGGSSYVCIQASTGNAVGNATAYWNIMSTKGTNGTNGTNGTDIGTTLTTQGDILYRDGSGLQRLAKGTAGQVLQMNSGATAPEYATASGGIVSSGNFSDGRNLFTHSFSNQTVSTSTSFIDVAGSNFNLSAGALSASKTCIFNYSVAAYLQDWVHGTLAIQYSADNGSAWYHWGNNSHDRHDFSHELASGTDGMERITGSLIMNFNAGQTPRFRMVALMYTGSNNIKINYGANNSGTVNSYYNVWFV